MSPESSTESYPAFTRIGLRENPGKNLNQVTCPDRDSNPGHLVSRPDALTRLNGARYQDFLINALPTLLEYVPCQQRLQMWFMHDGTPAHFFRNEREHLTLTFQGRWIDWGGPTP
ncbi:hypothetical protein ANN_21010 [Periplaneta americana]|uniref:Uncharacterized protein n=1 Tax=Periplaneta americana TaxID=6978 RepID=A0ABQ8SF20_PERAM|nr:hypothetical protein ANN_21010 [Periplaneta americana]